MKAASKLLVILILVVACLWLFRALERELPFKRVVLVTIDTLRADHLGSYGYFRDTSPFLDRLSEEGVRFSNVISASSHTGPSHASIFTGLYPFQHRLLANGQRLSPHIFHLKDLFSELGFEVKGFSAVRFMNGFVGFDAVDRDTMKYKKRSPMIKGAKNVDRAIEWLNQRDSNSPFFLWLHLYDVHQWGLPGHIPKPEKSLMQQTPSSSLEEFLFKHHALPEGFFKNEEKLLATMNGYDAQIRYVDGQLERLHNHFAKLGILDETLWMVTSDHGEGLGNHFYIGHGEHLYQEQLSVPLIISARNSGKGYFVPGIVDGLVRSIDLMPTLADLFSYDLLRHRDPSLSARLGISQAQAVLAKSTTRTAASTDLGAFSQRRPKDTTTFRKRWRDGDVYSVQDQVSKIISYSDGADQCFDLREDPDEEVDLYAGSQEKVSPDICGKNLNNLKKILDEQTSNPNLSIDAIKNGAEKNNSEVDSDVVEDLKTLGYL